jgi:RNA polymerase sigma factor (sigma-70 family)
VGMGSTGVAEAPPIVAEPDVATEDRRLVAAVRRGDDRAFEALYQRYHRRIAAYVLGMVKDHGRAEDVTQEVFVAALRRMRETERPIAFKPWVYEIAKNACIDQFRRSRRSEEVSYDATGGLGFADYGRFVASEPTPDVAVAAKQELDDLCGAFVGLSDTHHQILVLRELEGRSYREIGEEMGMSRPAVESTLFRARRRLTEEYDELVSGARCRRVHVLIETAVESRIGARESSRLSRHLAHCQSCRREAIAAGVDSSLLAHVPARRRVSTGAAALLPFPAFLRGRGRGAGGEAAASLASSPIGPGWIAQLPIVSDQLAHGWGKLAAVAAVLVAGVGAAGVGTQVAADRGAPPPAEHRAVQERLAGGDQDRPLPSIGGLPAAAPARGGSAPATTAPERGAAAGRDERATGEARPGAGRPRDTAEVPAAPLADPPAGAAPDTVTRPITDATKRTGDGATPESPRVKAPAVPVVELPAAKTDPVETADPVETVDRVTEPVIEAPPSIPAGGTGATEPVEEAAQPVTDVVDDAVEGATGELPDVPLP